MAVQRARRITGPRAQISTKNIVPQLSSSCQLKSFEKWRAPGEFNSAPHPYRGCASASMLETLGAPGQNRTGDFLLTGQVLCRLSHRRVSGDLYQLAPFGYLPASTLAVHYSDETLPLEGRILPRLLQPRCLGRGQPRSAHLLRQTWSEGPDSNWRDLPGRQTY